MLVISKIWDKKYIETDTNFQNNSDEDHKSKGNQ